MFFSCDPNSQTTPVPILQRWKDLFGLGFEVWEQHRYMPSYFLSGDYDQVPRMIKIQDKNASKWQDAEETEEHLLQDYQDINNHRYRQARFLQHCSKAIQDSSDYKWMAHIDTDEYIVLNPTLRDTDSASSFPVKVPTSPKRSSLMTFLRRYLRKDAFEPNWPCISMPRIFFGAEEDKGESSSVNSTIIVPSGESFRRSRFESLRWKYHTKYSNEELNRQPKAIMDVSGFPAFNLTRKAFSIHRPSLHLCRKQGQMDIHDARKYPLVVHHYLGSFQRYKARDDPRRSDSQYWAKSAIRDMRDDDYIDSWLASFTSQNGAHEISQVLGDYLTSASKPENSLDDDSLTNEKADNNGNGTISFDDLTDKPSLRGKLLPAERDSTSACLLIKDDNPILGEWLAYHHHLFKLRTLIVAVDPTSKTSPSEILGRWHGLMEIQEWSDETFMPDFFLKGDYSQIPKMLWNTTSDGSADETESDMEQVEKDRQTEINAHRFRQLKFLSRCIQTLSQQNKTWMFHIDTDEYIVLHPKLRELATWRNVPIDTTMHADSLFDILKETVHNDSERLSYPCVSFPRLLYGSREDGNSTMRLANFPTSFDGSKFETTRWKYHAEYDVGPAINGKPKTMLDLSGVPPRASFLQNGVYSIHRPGLRMCRPDRKVAYSHSGHFPLTINHYIGSWERYSHREDVRRNRQAYEAKALLPSIRDDNWLDGWVSSFVEKHGLEKAKQLLKENLVDGENEFGDEDETIDEGVVPMPELPSFNKSTREDVSACMLVKDDNAILNEWIAYHYHVLGIRTLIVAKDPQSQTSPGRILEKWRQLGMYIEEWTEDMFMPDIYFQKAYHLQPRLVKIKRNRDKWLEGIEDPAMKKKYVDDIQDHRFRQITFLATCIQKLQELGRTWTIHIDTDEYIVINPELRVNAKNEISRSVQPSVLLELLNERIESNPVGLTYPCVSLPRLLFGSEEDSHIPAPSNPVLSEYNHSRFESLRWKYHAEYDDAALNKQPKVILDISVIPRTDKMFQDQRVFSIHRPSKEFCRPRGEMDMYDTDSFPLTVNHYLGTWDRFGARDDPRRNKKLYEQKAQVRAGRERDDWMETWLPSFISTVGEEKAAELLHNYRKEQ
eukprot:Nitzschia sp. Nitz4//scaffold225_size51843//9625//12995//NITZ4_006892-RA/size51843-snap-gene-0.8-mRNA-1//-1//CDS//3329542666//9235//frame0